MTDTHRVLWGEGMLLSPQHFQQWDRHHAALLEERTRSLRPHDWGFTRIEIDVEALLGGRLSVRDCAGYFDDGTPFDAKSRDQLPAERGFKDVFDAAKGGLLVYLAVPASRTGGVTCGDPGVAGEAAPQTPFIRDSLGVQDETKAGAEREVSIARANLAVRFGGESLDDFRALPIARIVATASGEYALDEKFVPPCLHIGLAPSVVGTLRRTIEVLSSRATDLAGQQRASGGMAEVAAFWLLHTFYAHLPALMHQHGHSRTHPETAFLELSTLAAELCTFAEGFDPRDFPSYDHAALTKTFGDLGEIVRKLLDTVVPSRCVAIPLEKTGESLFTSTVHDDRLLADGQVYAGVVADIEEDRLLVEFPGKVKVTSREKLQQLLTMAVPGLSVKHVPVPPPEIPVQPGRVYFQFVKSGEHWDAIHSTRTIALHVPPGFPGLRIDLMTVKD